MSRNSTKNKKKRGVSVTAILLEKFQKNVPKKCSREFLRQQQRVKRLFVFRSDTHKDLDEKISWVFGVKEYKFLECIKNGNQLVISSNQHMDGLDAINRRGCLYLCKDTSKVRINITTLNQSTGLVLYT